MLVAYLRSSQHIFFVQNYDILLPHTIGQDILVEFFLNIYYYSELKI